MPRPKKEKPNHAGGLYEVKITTGKTIDGKLIRKSFYSSISKDDAKKQAEEWKIEQEVANRTGTIFVEKSYSFEEWAKIWLETYKKPNIDDNTYRLTYVNTVENHLIPYFGKSLLRDVRQIDVVNFYSTKNALSESMLKKMQMCLNAIFEAAINNDLCYKNPAKNVRFTVSKAKNVKRVYSDEQIKWIENFAVSRLPEIIVLLETGLRRGELLGLKWDDIDFEKNTLSVKRSIASRHGGGITVNPPKWNSFRTNPLSIRALDVLKSMPKTSEYVFPCKTGEPQNPNTWSQKLKRVMLEASEVNGNLSCLTAHEMRHTYGTRLRRKGVDIYSIQKIMGHKDIKMTTEIYVHNEIELLKKAVEKSF